MTAKKSKKTAAANTNKKVSRKTTVKKAAKKKVTAKATKKKVTVKATKKKAPAKAAKKRVSAKATKKKAPAKAAKKKAPAKAAKKKAPAKATKKKVTKRTAAGKVTKKKTAGTAAKPAAKSTAKPAVEPAVEPEPQEPGLPLKEVRARLGLIGPQIADLDWLEGLYLYGRALVEVPRLERVDFIVVYRGRHGAKRLKAEESELRTLLEAVLPLDFELNRGTLEVGRLLSEGNPAAMAHLGYAEPVFTRSV